MIRNKSTIYTKAYFSSLEKADQGEMPRNLRILLKIEKYIKRGELLDVGVGSGLFLRLAKSHGFSVQGLDISRYSINHLIKSFKIAGKVDKLETSQYKEKSFNVINLRHTIEHIDSPDTALQNAYKILKSGGVICVSTPNSFGIHAQIYGKSWPHWCFQYHKHFYSKHSLSQLLKDSGFEILESNTEELSINNILRAALNRLGVKSDITKPSRYSLKVDKILARFGLGEGIVILARKPYDKK